MTLDLGDVRLVTASAYPALMGSLVAHPSTVCVLSGDADSDALVPVTVPKQSLEAWGGARRRWRDADVATLAEFVPKVLAEAPDDRRPLVVVAPRFTAAWRSAAASWPSQLRPPERCTTDHARVAEDKSFVRGELAALGLPVPESVTLPATGIAFGRVSGVLGTPFVLQAPNSAGGQGTYLITDDSDLRVTLTARPDVQRWLVSAYAGEVTINVSGVVHDDGHELLPASVQSSGIAEVGAGFGAYCGSDFGAVTSLPPGVLSEAYHHTARVADWLRGLGHRGLFGADIAVAGSRLSFLEVNPRIQGSSWLVDSVLRRGRGRGCLDTHVAAILGQPARRDPRLVASADSQLIVRWTGRTGVVRRVQPIHEADYQVTGLPLRGTVLSNGAIVARIASSGPLAGSTGTALTGEAQRLVATINAAIQVAGP